MSVFIGFTSALLGCIADFLMCEPIIYFVGCFVLLLVCAAFGRLIHISR